jgi:transcriptional regulator with XRE-family HTH domain
LGAVLVGGLKFAYLQICVMMCGMDIKNVIELLKDGSGLNSAKLADALDVPASTITRSLRGEMSPTFGKVNAWLDKAGYEMHILRKNPDVYSLSRFRELFYSAEDSRDYYLRVHRYLKQLLEHYAAGAATPDLNATGEDIGDANWRAFYAAAVAYLAQAIGKRSPVWTMDGRYVAPSPWVPFGKLGRSHTELDPIFSAHNVLLPKGELQWI